MCSAYLKPPLIPEGSKVSTRGEVLLERVLASRKAVAVLWSAGISLEMPNTHILQIF